MPLAHFDHSPQLIRLAARAARASYCDTPETAAAFLAPLGLQGHIQCFAREESEGILYTDETQGILAFRGSQTLGDWLYNANVELSAWEGTGKVHKGFLAALDACWPLIGESITRVGNSVPLLLCGHSLGGALAMLAAERLRLLGVDAQAVLTFGNPKVGDAAFAAAFKENYAGKYCSFLNQGDPVPWLPMLQTDFTVAGAGVQFAHSGDLQPRPPQWQAMLMLVSGMMSEQPSNLLELRPHSKDEYMRLADQHFSF